MDYKQIAQKNVSIFQQIDFNIDDQIKKLLD